jgi:hypothetical protein
VLGLGAMLFMLTLDYRTFTDKSHLIYISCARAATSCSSAWCDGRRRDPLRVFNLQSESPRSGWRWCSPSSSARTRHAVVDRSGIGATLTAVPLILIAKKPDSAAVTLLPVFFAVAYLAGMRLRIFGLMFLCLLGSADRVEVRAQGLKKSRVSTFLDPSLVRKAPAISRFRRASRSDRGLPVRDS